MNAVAAALLAASRPVTYMIFDVLSLDGADLLREPYERRRDDSRRRSAWPAITGSARRPSADGVATKEAADENALEGVMAKRLTSVYRPGQRSADWVKVKIDQTAEFVVGGWRPGARDARRAAGRRTDEGRSGLPRTRRRRHFGGVRAVAARGAAAASKPPTSPFATPIPRPDAKDARWVRPELVVEVRYGQQTAGQPAAFPAVPAAASGPHRRRGRAISRTLGYGRHDAQTMAT